MNESQIEQIRALVQEIADDEGIGFDDAFGIALGVLKLHALDVPKGKASGGSSRHSGYSHADQS